MVKLLVLGGSEFVGAAIVDDAVDRGWQVTTVNRGTRPAHPGSTALTGDRRAEGGLEAIDSGTWDLVVDTWSSEPSVVRDSAELLASRAGHYSYISSRSVYAYPAVAGADESAPVVEGSPDTSANDDYAKSKRGGELATLAAFGDRALCLRAGLVLGPRENIGRLPWWLGRMVRGGNVLCPGPADAGIQYVDARDLAHFTLSSATAGRGGLSTWSRRSGPSRCGTCSTNAVTSPGRTPSCGGISQTTSWPRASNRGPSSPCGFRRGPTTRRCTNQM